MRKAFRGSGKAGTQMSKSAFVTSLVFVLALMCTFICIMSTRYIENRARYEGYHNVIIVNAPRSLKNFINHPEVNVSYRLFTEHKKTDALYDVMTFSKWMKEEKAFITVVFPKDFDDEITSGKTPEVLTYILGDRLKYAEWRNIVVDEPLYEYGEYLKDRFGLSFESGEGIEIIEQPATLNGGLSATGMFLLTAANSVIPIIMIMLILYMGMSSGTNAVSGEKEKGTFAGLIMTPVPRLTIVTATLTGVFLSTVIAPVVILILLMFVPLFASITGFIYPLLLIMSLSLFICSLTVLISIMNDTTVAAQTAFLPVFFILISISVTCMQNADEARRFLYWFPVYGHFYGIGAALSGRSIGGSPLSVIDVLLCVATTLIVTFIIVLISERLLHSERFTVTTESVSDKKALRDAKAMKKRAMRASAPAVAKLFGYEPRLKEKKKTNSQFISGQFFFPLWTLGLCQLPAMAVTLLNFSTGKKFSDLIISLKSVETFSDVFKVTFDILAMFLKDPLFLGLMGVSYVLVILIYILRNNRFDRQPFSSLGFGGDSPVRDYGAGLLLGLSMMTSVFLILIFTGNVSFDGFSDPSVSIPAALISLFMWIPQGACEEVMFRGFMMSRTAARFGTVFAVCFSSGMFSLFHGLNLGISVLAVINLILIAVLFALISIWRDSIWVTCAAHTIWNFAQGGLFGLSVSGNVIEGSVITTSEGPNASDIWTGGDFGPEGGLAVTLVTLFAMGLVILLMRRKKKDAGYASNGIEEAVPLAR